MNQSTKKREENEEWVDVSPLLLDQPEYCCTSCQAVVLAADSLWCGGDPFGITMDGEGDGEPHPYCKSCYEGLKKRTEK